MVTSVDTLRIFERLRGAELSDRAAKEIAEVFREIVEDRLTTKTDLEMAKSELKKDIEIVKSELKKDLEMAKSELKAEIETSKSELQFKIEKSKSETLKWIFLFWAGQLFAMFAMFKAFFK